MKSVGDFGSVGEDAEAFSSSSRMIIAAEEAQSVVDERERDEQAAFAAAEGISWAKLLHNDALLSGLVRY